MSDEEGSPGREVLLRFVAELMASFPKAPDDSLGEALARLVIPFPQDDESETVELIIGALADLQYDLHAIEEGPGTVDQRARRMRKRLLKAGLVRTTEGRQLQDMIAWVKAISYGLTPQDAVRLIAKGDAREVRTVVKSLERGFKKHGIQPPVPIPQFRDT